MQLSDKVKPAIQGSHDLEEPSTAQTTKGKNLKTPPTKYLITFFLVVVFLTAVISLALSLDHRKSSPGNQWTKSNVPAEAEMEAANQVANEVLNLSRQLGEFRNDLQEQNYIIANLSLERLKKFTSLQSLLSASPAPPGKNGTKGNTGEQGPPGLTGLTGLPGAQGLKGPEGRKGHEGPPGEKGDQGLPGLPGIEGVKGPYGVPGYSGPKGEPGADGPPGVLGQAGRTGFNGSQGPPGPPGPAGPRGPPGYNASRPNGSDAKDPSQVANKPSAQLMGGDHHEQLYATDQVLTKWNPNDTDSHLMYGFEYSQGKLRVPRDGRYHVYAQLHIKSTGQAPSNHVAVFAGNRSVLMIKARPVGEQTRFVAGVFQLAKGEMVYIKPIYETMIWLGPDLSCFGAYMI